jgi:peptidoglycan/LPS O-acetylase OafA/YrhL
MPDDAGLRRLRRVPGLDVLRALAVSLVFLSHIWELDKDSAIDSIFAKSGFLGVDLFFVLSGFLITALLLQEQHDTGRIRFGRFYLRRALRLLPALFFFFAVYLVYARYNDWPPFDRPQDVLASVQATSFYYMNWRVLWTPLLTADFAALWSLSIEEQFYLVWPVLVAGYLGFRQRAGTVVIVLAMAFTAVTVWRIVVFHRYGWEAAYLRTDTRFDGLILGALVASLFVRGLTPAKLPRWTPYAVAVVWTGVLLTAHADRASAYQGLLTLWIAGGAVLILYLVSDPRPLTNTVSRTAQRIGMVSYALYLWQLPVIKAVVRWTPEWAWPGRLLVSTVLLAAAAVVSWLAIERPAQALRRRLESRAAPGAVSTTAVSDAGG